MVRSVHTTGIVLYVVHKTHLPGSFAVHRKSRANVLQLSPSSGKVSNNNFGLLSPAVRAIALGGRMAPEITSRFPHCQCNLRRILSCEGTVYEIFPELFSYLGLAPEAMHRVTAQSLTHKGVKHSMPGSSSDLKLEEKVLFNTFSFWHYCTPLSPSCSSWTLSSYCNPRANHKSPFLPPSLHSAVLLERDVRIKQKEV